MPTTPPADAQLVVILPHEYDAQVWGYIHRASCWHVGRDQGAAHPYPRRPTTAAECAEHPEWGYCRSCQPMV
jgi:hypothetical protein